MSRRARGRRAAARARRALQVLYALDVPARDAAERRAAAPEPLEALDALAAHFELPPAARAFAEELVHGVAAAAREARPARSRACARNWRLERMAAVDRNILRLAAYEILFTGTPAAVVIDEAVELARGFGGDASPRFVNGVLDALVREAEETAMTVTLGDRARRRAGCRASRGPPGGAVLRRRSAAARARRLGRLAALRPARRGARRRPPSSRRGEATLVPSGAGSRAARAPRRPRPARRVRLRRSCARRRAAPRCSWPPSAPASSPSPSRPGAHRPRARDGRAAGDRGLREAPRRARRSRSACGSSSRRATRARRSPRCARCRPSWTAAA